MADAEDEAAEKNIQMWKIKKLIKRLTEARGNGTSMISLIIPPGDQVSRVQRMLSEEMGTASNIKSRVNRLSVLSAIGSTQQRLKLYPRIPKNGLVLYCGQILTEENKEKKVNIDFEPFRPINTSLYLCDNKFHTEDLNELLEDDDKFGFIVMDGNGSLFGTLSGNTREIITKFSVDLPKKHGRGGQSALRFARLRLEKRHNYVRKVAEVAVQCFITDNRPNVKGLILAVVKLVDVSYGGENGFNQAIELSAETLANVKFVQEKKLIGNYFDQISQDTGKYCFGVGDTMKALELGAVETLILWENLDLTRYELKNNSTEEITVHFLNKEEENDNKYFVDKETGVDLEVVENENIVEWFSNNYKKYGCKLEFITNRSQEGSQFCKGFGGIGGLLRWQVDFGVFGEPAEVGDEDYDEWGDVDAEADWGF